MALALAEDRVTFVPKGVVGVPWPISNYAIDKPLMGWAESSVRILPDADEMGEGDDGQ